jgi:hypothetical protein
MNPFSRIISRIPIGDLLEMKISLLQMHPLKNISSILESSLWNSKAASPKIAPLCSPIEKVLKNRKK